MVSKITPLTLDEYLKKIDQVINFILDNASDTGKKKLKFCQDLQKKYITYCLEEIDRRLPGKEEEFLTASYSKEKVMAFFQKVKESLGAEKLTAIFISQAERILEELANIVSKQRDSNLTKKYNSMIKKLFCFQPSDKNG